MFVMLLMFVGTLMYVEQKLSLPLPSINVCYIYIYLIYKILVSQC
jgi:hypothetical protein